MQGLKAPVERRFSVFLQKGVDLREGPAAEEAAVGRQRAGVRRFQNEPRRGGMDQSFLFLRVRSPENEGDGLRQRVGRGNDRIGEALDRKSVV